MVSIASHLLKVGVLYVEDEKETALLGIEPQLLAF
jgi:hypothetical protein